MELYARIVNGVLEPGSVGALPVFSRRLDTGEKVEDLAAVGTTRQRAAGWYRVADLELGVGRLTNDNLNEVVPMPGFAQSLTLDQRFTLRAALIAAIARSTSRQALGTRVAEATNLARDANWDWIDKFCHETVAAVPFVRDQSPNAGAIWGTLTTAGKAEALRLGTSFALAELLRVAQALDLLFDALADPIATADVDATPDR